MIPDKKWQCIEGESPSSSSGSSSEIKRKEGGKLDSFANMQTIGSKAICLRSEGDEEKQTYCKDGFFACAESVGKKKEEEISNKPTFAPDPSRASINNAMAVLLSGCTFANSTFSITIQQGASPNVSPMVVYNEVEPKTTSPQMPSIREDDKPKLKLIFKKKMDE
jgi:hypothetical protein